MKYILELYRVHSYIFNLAFKTNTGIDSNLKYLRQDLAYTLSRHSHLWIGIDGNVQPSKLNTDSVRWL